MKVDKLKFELKLAHDTIKALEAQIKVLHNELLKIDNGYKIKECFMMDLGTFGKRIVFKVPK